MPVPGNRRAPADPAAQRWYRQAVVYCVDVDTFVDSDGDGWGDLAGLTGRLPHLARLGVSCLWLNPIHPSPNRDNGYDVSDYYAVDPRLGTLGDFVQLVHAAADHGIRVIIDLVVNHTSDQHPWFQSARSSRRSPHRDWYVWSTQEPPDRHQGVVFPGEQTETWTWDEQAGAWYYHRFYDFQPDLNWANPQVRAEIDRVIGFWLQLGVSGFRVDAAPFVIELVQPGQDPGPLDFGILDEWRQHLQWRRADAVLLGEANVDPDQVPQYYGSGNGMADRMHLLFDFVLNPQIMLALARQDAEPLAGALRNAPVIPDGAQWATFLRNHDELDLSRLTSDQRAEVFAAFGPRRRMQLYGRGLRRRLAPMLGNDRRRLELAYALQFSLPGTPVLRYGEEIGMGDNLALAGRDAFRTPMQWDDSRNAGFSTAPAQELIRPVINRGEFSYKAVNVTAQRADRDSLLTWFARLISVRRECPEIGDGQTEVIDVELPRGVLAHRIEDAAGSMVFLHNLSDVAVTVDLSQLSGADRVEQMFADGSADPALTDLTGIPLADFGYRWIRIGRRGSSRG
jgi:maltose alpha-D-glucosyltransferase/alpha-amylase